MIPRYTLPEMASLWSDEARFSNMLEIEILAVEAWSLLGVVPGIPILGALFKSRSETKSKTELIVLVTPEIVTPLLAGDAKPVPEMPREFLAPLEKPQMKFTKEPKSKKEPKN